MVCVAAAPEEGAAAGVEAAAVVLTAAVEGAAAEGAGTLTTMATAVESPGAPAISTHEEGSMVQRWEE